jgi:hypothetical protein
MRRSGRLSDAAETGQIGYKASTDADSTKTLLLKNFHPPNRPVGDKLQGVSDQMMKASPWAVRGFYSDGLE